MMTSPTTSSRWTGSIFHRAPVSMLGLILALSGLAGVAGAFVLREPTSPSQPASSQVTISAADGNDWLWLVNELPAGDIGDGPLEGFSQPEDCSVAIVDRSETAAPAQPDLTADFHDDDDDDEGEDDEGEDD
jgi:hypothetical protein